MPRAHGIDRGLYLDERKELYKYQQASYDSFEKTLVALSGAFLAFSTGFLGFLKGTQTTPKVIVAPGSANFLLGSWISFAFALVLLMLCAFVNVRAYTIEIIKLEDALKDDRALNRPNNWAKFSKF